MATTTQKKKPTTGKYNDSRKTGRDNRNTIENQLGGKMRNSYEYERYINDTASSTALSNMDLLMKTQIPQLNENINTLNTKLDTMNSNLNEIISALHEIAAAVAANG